uniref:Sodium/calcium exchanger membrane region domain-containing protein n=1 Tax=Globodera rostochiensis TaxID=31243 RepID=A0A914IA55_GLORO
MGRQRLFWKHWQLAFGILIALLALFGFFSLSKELNDQSLSHGTHRRISKRQSELELVEQELNKLKLHTPGEHNNRSNNCVIAEERTNRSVIDPFPTDLFSLDQRRHGAVLLHFCGLIYMFVALAVVCDEFFVPSLSVITEVLSISDDVAGATFMAAGGSAPEFFTSLFGVFITENNVGLGTIVGSATFNILCVLACCTLFSHSTLSLSWWPLFRDILFYSVALLALTYCLLDERVHWVEAAAMFLIYLLYAIFMKNNGRIEVAVKKCFVRVGKICDNRVEPMTENPMEPSTVPLEVNENAVRPTSRERADDTFVAHRLGQTTALAVNPCGFGRSSISLLHAGAHYPQIYPGIVQVALDPRNLFGSQSAHPPQKVAFVSRNSSNQSLDIDGRKRKKKRRLDKAKSLPSFTLERTVGESNGHLKVEPPRQCRSDTPYPPPALSPHSLTSVPLTPVSPCSAMPMNGCGAGLPPVNIPPSTQFLKGFDAAQNNQFPPPVRSSTLNTAKAAETELEKNGIATDGEDSHRQTPSVNGEIPFKIGANDGIGGDEEKPVDLSWPRGVYKQFVFLLLAPIMFPLALTLPDVKREDRKKYVGVTFIGSVAWIAFFTYMMVWWASTIGQTLGLPTEVIGLTILAAGTSIPDLITSVIVSRKGLGDMAVSSSIGSNLFDICVGLPVPWLLHFMFREQNFIAVHSNGLLCSVGILFLMIVVLVVAVTITRWRMSKLFGAIMFLAYLLFCLLSVLLEKSLLYCPLKLVSGSRKWNGC